MKDQETCGHPGLAVVKYAESEWHQSYQCSLCFYVRSFWKELPPEPPKLDTTPAFEMHPLPPEPVIPGKR